MVAHTWNLCERSTNSPGQCHSTAEPMSAWQFQGLYLKVFQTAIIDINWIYILCRAQMFRRLRLYFENRSTSIWASRVVSDWSKQKLNLLSIVSAEACGQTFGRHPQIAFRIKGENIQWQLLVGHCPPHFLKNYTTTIAMMISTVSVVTLSQILSHEFHVTAVFSV